jgi:PKD repeat protein
VYPNPAAGFTINKSLQCLNNNQFMFADTSSVSSGVLSYFWQFGNGDTSTTNSPVFTYQNGGTFNVKVVVTTEFACKDSVTKQVTVTSPVAQSLCLITVDSTLGKNVLVWERSNKAAQTGYKIYKETAVPNTYEHIGYVSSDSSGVYVDTASTPNTKADSYVITAIDSCGGESEKSALHKPLHLDITVGGASVVLNWGAYQGLTGNTILIYRGSSAGTMSLIASVQGSVSSYTDLAPIDGINYYMIAMDFGKTCDPGIFQAPPITVTTSNIVSALFTGVEDLSNITGLKLYPNPANKLVNLEFEALEGNSAIEIFDISGKSVYQSTFTHNRGSFKQSFDISALQTGVYIAKITCGSQSKNVKLLVN